MAARAVHIGGGAGFAGDRTDAAGPIVEVLRRADGDRYLVFETLAERTLALAQVERRRDPGRGYSPALERFLTPVLRDCLAAGIRIVGNFGAANPRAGAARVAAMAREMGGRTPRIAYVTGDDITGVLSARELAARETGGRLLTAETEVVSANAYIGAAPIAEALARGADVVVTGRVADPSLVLGPLLHSFAWHLDDWDRLAAGTLAGHLLECGSQVTGGYFADPGVKDVPGMDVLGYPIAEVAADGTFLVTKSAGTGGVVDRRTVTEQVLYEIHDPAAYLTPDVVMDVTDVELAEVGPDRVRVSGARGKPKPPTLKATVCMDLGRLAEAEISYAGRNAVARAKLAAEVIQARMARRAPGLAVRVDAFGLMSVHGDSGGVRLGHAWETSGCEDVRLRFAAQSKTMPDLEMLLAEVEALYCAGPAGGAGVRTRITPRLASASCLIERGLVRSEVGFIGGAT